MWPSVLYFTTPRESAALAPRQPGRSGGAHSARVTSRGHAHALFSDFPHRSAHRSASTWERKAEHTREQSSRFSRAFFLSRETRAAPTFLHAQPLRSPRRPAIATTRSPEINHIQPSTPSCRVTYPDVIDSLPWSMTLRARAGNSSASHALPRDRRDNSRFTKQVLPPPSSPLLCLRQPSFSPFFSFFPRHFAMPHEPTLITLLRFVWGFCSYTFLSLFETVAESEGLRGKKPCIRLIQRTFSDGLMFRKCFVSISLIAQLSEKKKDEMYTWAWVVGDFAILFCCNCCSLFEWKVDVTWMVF